MICSVTHLSKLLRTIAALLSKYETKSLWVSSSLSTYVEPMVIFGVVLSCRKTRGDDSVQDLFGRRAARRRLSEVTLILITMSGRKLNPTELKLHQSALADPQKVS